jgi:long-chain fatty acid transport protein
MGRRRFLVMIGICAAMAKPPAALLAGGFAIPHQSPKGLALAGAFVGGTDDPSAVFYNPAALVEVDGNRLLLVSSYAHIASRVQNSGRTAVNQHDDQILGSLFANYHVPSTPITLGFGAYSPFGLATTYERDFVRFAALRSELRTLYLTPALAWKVSESLSVGAGASFVRASSILSRSLCFDIFAGCLDQEGPLEAKIRLTDTDTAWTYAIGLLIKPTLRTKIGVNYRARADLDFNHATVKLEGALAPARVSAKVRPIPLPPVLSVGLFWRIADSAGVEFVYEHARWSEFKSVKASLSPPPTLAPFGARIAGFNLPQDWKDGSTLRLGAFHRIDERLEIRAGTALGESPIPKRTLTPAIPGGHVASINVGGAYRFARFSVEVGYMLAFHRKRRVSNPELEGRPATNIPFLGAPGKDTYRTLNHFFSVGLGSRF